MHAYMGQKKCRNLDCFQRPAYQKCLRKPWKFLICFSFLSRPLWKSCCFSSPTSHFVVQRTLLFLRDIYIYKLSMHSFPLKKHFRTLFIKKKYPVRRLLEWNVDIYLEKSPFDVFCEGGSTVKTSNGDPGKRNNRPRKKYSEKRRAQFGRTPGLRPFFYAGYLFLEVANIFLFAFKLVFAP